MLLLACRNSIFNILQEGAMPCIIGRSRLISIFRLFNNHRHNSKPPTIYPSPVKLMPTE